MKKILIVAITLLAMSSLVSCGEDTYDQRERIMKKRFFYLNKQTKSIEKDDSFMVHYYDSLLKIEENKWDILDSLQAFEN